MNEIEKLKAENEELKKENEEINSRMSDVIYRATGGRLCYSTYTLDAIEHAFQDQLEILSDRKTEELEKEYEELEKEYEELHIKYAGCKTANTAIQEENERLRKALKEIRTIAESFDYWRNTLAGASEKIHEIEEIVDEVIGVHK